MPEATAAVTTDVLTLTLTDIEKEKRDPTMDLEGDKVAAVMISWTWRGIGTMVVPPNLDKRNMMTCS